MHFVAPELILHYVSAHRYCPPEEFQIAVRACPKMLSFDYLQEVIKAGPAALAERARARLAADKLARIVVDSLVRSTLVQRTDIEMAVAVVTDSIEQGREWVFEE